MTLYEAKAIIGRKMDVIINADDLGISQEVNDAVFGLMGDGLVTSATIIANGPNLEDACQRLSEMPGCSFGVHLNVAEFAPVSGPDKLEPLLDDQGGFDVTKILDVPVTSTLKDGIYREFTAQIKRLKDLGLDITHIDSHLHIHTIPWMFPVLKKLQRKFQIRRVRPRGVFGAQADTKLSRRLLTQVYNFGLRNYYRSATPQIFLNFETFHERLLRNNLRYKTVEVMVHPGSHIFNHAKEIEMLKGPWRDEATKAIRLIDYRQLG
jgi:predicted glycoside hydrolase/deacetylase ChbG (UPF0249 family)